MSNKCIGSHPVVFIARFNASSMVSNLVQLNQNMGTETIMLTSYKTNNATMKSFLLRPTMYNY